jgi:hypothetical protein
MLLWWRNTWPEQTGGGAYPGPALAGELSLRRKEVQRVVVQYCLRA